MMCKTSQRTLPNNTPTTFASLSSITTVTKTNEHNDSNPQCQTPITTRPTKKSRLSVSSSPRNEIFDLGAKVGNLCQNILTHAPLDDTIDLAEDSSSVSFWSTPSDNREKIYDAIASVFACLVKISVVCGVDFRTSILKKIDLNGRKYPVELCKGKSGKYTKYSSQTGITKTNQSTLDISIPQDSNGHSTSGGVHAADEPLDTVPAVSGFIRKFAMDRNWPRYHTPRNITLAMLGEVGELAELFQWRSDQEGSDGTHGLLNIGWKEQDVDSVQQELADVAIYCLRLADVVGIQDLGQAVLNMYHD